MTERHARLRAAVSRHLAFCRSVLQGGVSYSGNLAWVLARSLEGCRLRTAAAVVCGQLALGAQAAAIGVFYWYLDQAQAGDVVTLDRFDLAWRREAPWLVGMVLGAFGLCLFASAGLLYWSERLFIRIGEETMARRVTDMARLSRRLPDPRAAAASRTFLESNNLKMITSSYQGAALCVVVLLGAVTPSFGGLVAGGVLLAIEPVLTSLLAGAAGLWCLLLYPPMMRQVADSNLQQRAKRAFWREWQTAIKAPPAVRTPEKLAGAVELARVAIGRRHARNSINLVLQTGMAAIGTAATVYLAVRFIGGHFDPATLAVYVASMRIAMNGCFAVPRVSALLSRYYPSVVVCVQFLRNAERIDTEPLGRAGAGDAVRLGSLPDRAAVDARGGDRVALATLAPPAAAQAAFLQARAAETGLPLASAWMRPGEPMRREDASIHLVDAGALAALEPAEAEAFLGRAPAGVTVVAHRDETGVGAFGESDLLVLGDDGFDRHVRLGTAESRAALASFAAVRAQAAGGPPKRAAPDGGAPGLPEPDDEM